MQHWGVWGFFLKGQQDNNRGSSLMHPLEVSGIKKKLTEEIMRYIAAASPIAKTFDV